MFGLCQSELQKLQALKTSQLLSTMFSDLRFEELVPTVSRADLSTAFNEVFDQYSRLHTYQRSDKVFAFYALSLIKGVGNILMSSVGDSVGHFLKGDMAESLDGASASPSKLVKSNNTPTITDDRNVHSLAA